MAVYVSAPLRGEEAALGQAITRGSRLALAEVDSEVSGVELRGVYLDETSERGRGAEWDPIAVSENARQAARDAGAVAFLDGPERASLRTSGPILSTPRILHLAPSPDGTPARPGSGFARLYERRYGQRPGRWAAYGYAATGAVLEAIAAAPDPSDRAGIGDAYEPGATPGVVRADIPGD